SSTYFSASRRRKRPARTAGRAAIVARALANGQVYSCNTFKNRNGSPRNSTHHSNTASPHFEWARIRSHAKCYALCESGLEIALVRIDVASAKSQIQLNLENIWDTFRQKRRS